MESHSKHDALFVYGAQKDIVESFIDTVEVQNKIKINVESNIANFKQEEDKIEATLRKRTCEMAGGGEKAKLFLTENEEWKPVCGNTRKHNISQYSFEQLDSIVNKKLKMVEIFRHTLMKGHVIIQLVDFCTKNQGDLQQFSEKIRLIDQEKISNAIAEFKQNTSKLQNNSSLLEYEFIESLMQKVNKVFDKNYKFAPKIIAKYLFKNLKDKLKKQSSLHLRKKTKEVVKLGGIQRKLISKTRKYQKYSELTKTLDKKLKMIREYKTQNYLNHRKMTAKDLLEFKNQYKSSFDHLLIDSFDLEAKTKIIYYDFNLYESVHYKAIKGLKTGKGWLGNCDQLTLGGHIHDKSLYDYFMQYSFPDKVKDLKIVYHRGMGERTKLWYDHEFRNNAGRITDKVRFCGLKLDKNDISEIFKLFNHAKSIWFLNCEIDINKEIDFK